MSKNNEVTLKGNLGAKPELRYTSNGTAVLNAQVATNESWKNEHGDWQKKTTWTRIVLWGKKAEEAVELDKGMLIEVKGSLENNDYTDKNGIEHRTMQVKAFEIKKLERKPKTETQKEPETPRTEDIPF